MDNIFLIVKALRKYESAIQSLELAERLLKNATTDIEENLKNVKDSIPRREDVVALNPKVREFLYNDLEDLRTSVETYAMRLQSRMIKSIENN